MKETTSEDQETADRLLEDISKIEGFALGEGVGSCLVCGQDVVEGMEVEVVVFRRAGSPAFDVQYMMCCEHLDECSTGFTLGVREVMVRGWFGWCSFDQSVLCPVVVSPTVVGVSGASTRSLREVPDGEGIDVDLGDRLSCEVENSDGRALPRLRVVVELPCECWVEQPVGGAENEATEVSGHGE